MSIIKRWWSIDVKSGCDAVIKVITVEKQINELIKCMHIGIYYITLRLCLEV